MYVYNFLAITNPKGREVISHLKDNCLLPIKKNDFYKKKTIIYIKKRRFVHNIFTTNYKWLVVIGSNLNLTLKLLFCPNNNN